MPGAKNWVFTLNNYDDIEGDRSRRDIVDSFLSQSYVRYWIYAEEVGEEGTPHLQGYVVFTTRKTLSRIKKDSGLQSLHLEPRKGTHEQARDYCNGGPISTGGSEEGLGGDSSKGKRNDFVELKKYIDEGASIEDLESRYFSHMCRYGRYITNYWLKVNSKPKDLVEHDNLHDWQLDLKDELLEDADERKIIFLVDYKGGHGKSWFAKWFTFHYGGQVLKPAKQADMAMMLDVEAGVLFVDCSRSRSEVLNYDFLESVKDGVVCAPKYESRIKYMAGNVHVVVLMNDKPDKEKLSMDRYDIRYLH